MPDSTDSPVDAENVSTAPVVDAAEPTETAAPEQESATADNSGSEANAGPLPTDSTQTNVSPATGEALPQLKPEEIKQLLNLKSLYGRQAQELGQYRKQVEAYQGLPSPDEIRSALEQRQREAEVQKLQAWHPKHPEHQQAMSRLEKVRHYSAAVAANVNLPGLTPEQQDEIKARTASALGVSNDDIQFHNQWVQHDQTVRQEFARDPEGFIEQRVQARVENAIQQAFAKFEQYQSTRTTAQSFLAENGKLLETNRDRFLELMPQLGREGALQVIRLEEENKSLRGNIGKATQVQAQAQAQQSALKQRSKISRDGASQPVTQDPVELGRAKGFKGQRLAQFIHEYNSRPK